MASSGKQKTTMAKLNRERKVREKRVIKQARKDARKLAAAEQADRPDETPAEVEAEDEAQVPVEGSGEHAVARPAG